LEEGTFVAESGFNFGTYSLPGFILILFALGLSLVIWLVEFKLKYKGKMALACILAGPIIVVGYFLWEVIALGFPVETAFFEVPFNVAQVIFGTLIAVPLVTYLDELGILPARKPLEQ
jgi:ABC-type tungstate transport system substrate-binding protein